MLAASLSPSLARRALCLSAVRPLAPSPVASLSTQSPSSPSSRPPSLTPLLTPRPSAPHNRRIHSSHQRPNPPAPLPTSRFSVDHAPGTYDAASAPQPAASPSGPSAPLSVLPLSSILRSLMTTTVSSSPLLLGPSMAAMTGLAHSTSALLNPDKNPLLHYLLKKTFYAQFCAGENAREVARTIDGLKGIGFSGVILGYAKEVVMKDADKRNLAAALSGPGGAARTAAEVQAWADGTLETVRLASAGDFVALKFTGAGLQTLHDLTEQRPPSPALAHALDAICALAVQRGVRLLFDAEQAAVQAGIDAWTLAYMRKYNTATCSAVVYGTYQAYLKATGRVLADHLRAARAGGFALGVKLVRGAYLGSDPRALIHDSKADTDAAYDALAEALLRRAWQGPLAAGGAGDDAFPAVSLVVASHNAASVQHAHAVLASGAARTTDVAFAQLQGMADEVSCQLVLDAQAKKTEAAAAAAPPVRAYKYLVWGSTGECMKYLLRRAHENRDAVQRTRSSRDAMWHELVRRAKAAVFRSA